jgi:transposase
LGAKPSGPKGKSSAEKENDKLRADNERLARELAKSQAVVEIMGKLQGLLETISESTDTDPGSRR